MFFAQDQLGSKSDNAVWIVFSLILCILFSVSKGGEDWIRGEDEDGVGGEQGIMSSISLLERHMSSALEPKRGDCFYRITVPGCASVSWWNWPFGR